jgi:hypothetical protein
MNLQACRTHYAEAVPASPGGGERHIIVAYLCVPPTTRTHTHTHTCVSVVAM